MERVLADTSIVKYTAPLKIRDKDGIHLPQERRISTEITCKIDRGDASYEEVKRLQDILNCALPPREWEEDGELWMQQVSPRPVTREDMIQLKILVDRRLKELKALDKGIDPVRRHVYGQLFDELIRQELVMNAERGILLLKVRDELKTTLAVNQALFENGKLYGTHKAEQAQDSQELLVSRLTRHQKERDAILAEVNAMKYKYKEAKRVSVESLLRFDQVCLDELRRLNEMAIAMKQQIRETHAGLV